MTTNILKRGLAKSTFVLNQLINLGVYRMLKFMASRTWSEAILPHDIQNRTAPHMEIMGSFHQRGAKLLADSDTKLGI